MAVLYLLLHVIKAVIYTSQVSAEESHVDINFLNACFFSFKEFSTPVIKKSLILPSHPVNSTTSD